MFKINSISAISILDSRGIPTTQVMLSITNVNQVESNSVMVYYGKGSSPSGASTGSHEALELRDGDLKKYLGKGVEHAISNINNLIAPEILLKEFKNAGEVDQQMIELDGTMNKSKLGANAILAVSNAVHRAAAKAENLELFEYLRLQYFHDLGVEKKDYKYPRLMCNIINGGAHADNGISIQEFMVVPRVGSLQKDVEAISEIYQTLKAELHIAGMTTGLGDEGGFAPSFDGTENVLEFIRNSAVKAGYADKFDLALDVASSEFYDQTGQVYNIDSMEKTAKQMVEFYEDLIKEYNIISIEDGFDEDDFDGWKLMKKEFGDKIYQIGDDLFVTNTDRFIELADKNGLGNGILIKPNQIGTIKETCQVINKAKKLKYVTAISHRSGETIDAIISDIAYSCNSEFIKLGAPARGERVAKYNRLLEIEQFLK
jgi:enolase